MKMKKTISLLLVMAMLFGMNAMAAEPLSVTGETAAVDGQATSVVTVDAEPVQMTVTVPSILPANVNATGQAIVATDARVTNKSYGPVVVQKIDVVPNGSWAIADENHDFSAVKVGTKLVKVSIDGQAAAADGSVALSGNWTIPGNNQSRPFSYGVKIPAQKASFTENLASVVFTVDWDKEPPKYELVQILNLSGNYEMVPLNGLTITNEMREATKNRFSFDGILIGVREENSDRPLMAGSVSDFASVSDANVLRNDGLWQPDAIQLATIGAGTATIRFICDGSNGYGVPAMDISATVTVEESIPEASTDWEYTTSGDTITLTKYIGESNDVTVHNKYVVNGKVYNDVTLGETICNTPEPSDFVGDYHDRANVSSIEVKKGVKAPPRAGATFACFWNISSLELGGLDTSNVTDMDSMFYRCYSLTSLNLSGWDTGNVTNMTGMFYCCSSLTSLDLSTWDLSSLTYAYGMFESCSQLKTIYVKDYTAYNKLYNLNTNIPSGCSVIVGSPT